MKVLEAGGFFGEVALINHAPRAADCVAFTKLKVRPEAGRLCMYTRLFKLRGLRSNHGGTSLDAPSTDPLQRLDLRAAATI